MPSVNKVAQKQVVPFRAGAADPKQLDKIIKLAVDVSANSDGRVDPLDVRLFDQDLFGQVTQLQHFVLRERLALLELGDALVEVERHLCWLAAAASRGGRRARPRLLLRRRLARKRRSASARRAARIRLASV